MIRLTWLCRLGTDSNSASTGTSCAYITERVDRMVREIPPSRWPHLGAYSLYTFSALLDGCAR